LWEKDIVEEVKKVDYAFIDATFYSEGEIPRPMSEVPHPFIEETLELFRNESETTRSKIIFIHLNHSNPALLDNHPSKKRLETMGYQVAQQGAIFEL
jgi:pyrroloquinoline quinone biosynthesis protein B